MHLLGQLAINYLSHLISFLSFSPRSGPKARHVCRHPKLNFSKVDAPSSPPGFPIADKGTIKCLILSFSSYFPGPTATPVQSRTVHSVLESTPMTCVEPEPLGNAIHLTLLSLSPLWVSRQGPRLTPLPATSLPSATRG